MNLKQYLAIHGIKMGWFCREELGIHPVTLTSWLSGKCAISPEWVMRIEKYTFGHVSKKDWPRIGKGEFYES